MAIKGKNWRMRKNCRHWTLVGPTQIPKLICYSLKNPFNAFCPKLMLANLWPISLHSSARMDELDWMSSSKIQLLINSILFLNSRCLPRMLPCDHLSRSLPKLFQFYSPPIPFRFRSFSGWCNNLKFV